MKILDHHRIRSKDGQSAHLEERVAAMRGLGPEVLVAGPNAVDDAGLGAWVERRMPRSTRLVDHAIASPTVDIERQGVA